MLLKHAVIIRFKSLSERCGINYGDYQDRFRKDKLIMNEFECSTEQARDVTFERLFQIKGRLFRP